MIDWRSSGGALVVAGAIAVLVASGCSQKSSTESTATTSAGPASSGLPAQSWVVPVDVTSPNPTQSDWANFGWQTFVALDWPSQTPPPSAGGVIGLPDTTQSIGASSSSNQAMIPAVWLTYRSEASTMLANAQDPGPWSSSAAALPATCSPPSSPYPVAPGFQPMLLSMVSKFNPNNANNVDEASGPPLIEQTGWYVTYDIRIDQSEYTYIQQNGYYNGATQAQAEAQNTFAPFPRTGQEFASPLPSPAQFGALEVKSAWRVLDPVKDKAVIPRYYTQTGYFLQQDGVTCQGPTMFGLIGLHVLRLTPTTPSTWFWATFEQVDNVNSPPGSPEPATLAQANTPNGSCGTPPPYNVAPAVPTGNVPWNASNPKVNVCQVTPISAAVAQVNQNWQKNLAGTVWANYQMIDTINPSVQGGPQNPIPISNANVNTNILANTSMETYVQGSGAGNGQSCMDCHAFAQPQGAKGSTSANQIFTFVLGNAATPAPPGAAMHGGRAMRHGHRLPANVLAIIHKMKTRK